MALWQEASRGKSCVKNVSSRESRTEPGIPGTRGQMAHRGQKVGRGGGRDEIRKTASLIKRKSEGILVLVKEQ